MLLSLQLLAEAWHRMLCTIIANDCQAGLPSVTHLQHRAVCSLDPIITNHRQSTVVLHLLLLQVCEAAVSRRKEAEAKKATALSST
jgi:hypothetical protein